MTLPSGYLTPLQRDTLWHLSSTDLSAQVHALRKHADACDLLLAEKDQEIIRLKNGLLLNCTCTSDPLGRCVLRDACTAYLDSEIEAKDALLKECAQALRRFHGTHGRGDADTHQPGCGCVTHEVEAVIAKLEAAGISK